MHKKLITFLVIVLSAVCLFGCGNDEKEKKELFSGEWIELSIRSYLHRDTCEKINLKTEDDFWSINEDTIIWQNTEYKIIENYGITTLMDEKGNLYAREADADALYEDAFLEVEITTENWTDYIELVYVENPLDEWGDPMDPCYIVKSKMYDQGYIVCEEVDSGVDYGDGYSGGFMSDGSHGFNNYIQSEGVPTMLKSKGTTIYIKKEYVPVYELTRDARKYSMFDTRPWSTESSHGFNPDFPW